MIDVIVKVPEDRVPEFYSMYGTWLNAAPSVLSPADTRAIRDASERLPWSDSDAALAATVWDKFSATAKGLFSTLIDNPERQFSGDELSEILGISNGRHGVAGVLAWPGRHCFAVDRRWLWSWSYPVEGEPVVYWLTPEVATLFREARDR